MADFEVGVLEGFSARHYLVGGDFGPEGELHSHDYRVEVIVSGRSLDSHGFLVDIVRLKAELERLLDRLRGRTLNELPELEGQNPGVEVVSRTMALALRDALSDEGIETLTVKLWENESAWASYRVAGS